MNMMCTPLDLSRVGWQDMALFSYAHVARHSLFCMRAGWFEEEAGGRGGGRGGYQCSNYSCRKNKGTLYYAEISLLSSDTLFEKLLSVGANHR
jgi:hypothetical protein